MPGAGRHEPAEARGQGAGRQVPGRADLGRAVLRRADPGRRHRPPREEGDGPRPLAARAPSGAAGSSWFKSNLLAAPRPASPPGFIPDDHWFQKLRRVEPRPLPQARVAGRAVPRLRHRADRPDPAQDPRRARRVHAPEPDRLQAPGRRRDRAGRGGGYRVGWLDELPSGVPKEQADEEAAKEKDEKEKEKNKDRPEAKAKAAEAVFETAEAEREAQGQGRRTSRSPCPPRRTRTSGPGSTRSSTGPSP